MITGPLFPFKILGAEQQPTGDPICPHCHQYMALCTCGGMKGAKGWECPRCGKIWAPGFPNCTCEPKEWDK